MNEESQQKAFDQAIEVAISGGDLVYPLLLISLSFAVISFFFFRRAAEEDFPVLGFLSGIFSFGILIMSISCSADCSVAKNNPELFIMNKFYSREPKTVHHITVLPVR